MIHKAFKKDFIIRDFVMWTILKCGLKVLIDLVSIIQPVPFSFQSIFSEALSGAVGFIPVWLFGAVFSAVPLISYAAILAYFFIVIMLISKHDRIKTTRIRKALWFICALSIITLWIEPFITKYTIGGFVGSVIANALGAFLVPADIIISAIWLFSTVTIIRKINHTEDRKSINEKNLTNKSIRSKNIIFAMLLSFVGGGYFYLGQIGKGVLSIIWLLLSFQQPFFLVFGYLLSATDIQRLACQSRKGQPIGNWETKINQYTIGVITAFTVLLSAPLIALSGGG